MNTFKPAFATITMLIAVAAAPAPAAGTLEIRDAWIRSAPPNAMMLAGYATLHNAGDAAITISTVKATGFAESSMHETVLVGDVSQMRPITPLTVAPGESVLFTPGGKHIMLMQPTAPPAPDSLVTITFTSSDGADHSANFPILDAAPGHEAAMPVSHSH